MTPLSIVIVTKNRAQVLKHCLGSLVAQTIAPQQLIVIDNSSTDSTPKVVDNFKQQVSFPVHLVKENGDLYPVIYNCGLKEASSDWVAFIDDDCVADTRWLEALLDGINKYPLAATLVGQSNTYYPQNIFAVATWILDEIWKIEGRIGNKINNFATLDNKNIAYNQKFLQKNSLIYDEQRLCFMGAAEDADLGLQIQANGGNAVYLPRMIISHKDPQDWWWFWKKVIVAQRAFNTLASKWKSKVNFNSKKPLSMKEKFNLLDSSSLTLIKKFLVLSLIFTAGFITKNFLNDEKK